MSAVKQKGSEMLVGIFILVGLLILGALVVKFGRGEKSFKGESYEVTLTFQDASGLIKGSEVRMGGAKIGNVLTQPELNDELKVQMQVQLDARLKLDKASQFQIASLSIVGDKMVVVTPPEKEQRTGELIKAGDMIIGGGAGGLEALQNDAESVAHDARIAMRDARTMMLKMDSTLDDLRLLIGRFSDTVERVNQDVISTENIASVKHSLANIESATHSIKLTAEQAQPLIASMKTTIDAYKKVANSADAQLKSLSPALAGVPETVASIKETVTRAGGLVTSLKSTVDKVNDEKGLIGSLTGDTKLKSDTEKFVRNLKEHGILGYKDEETRDEKKAKDGRFRGRRR